MTVPAYRFSTAPMMDWTDRHWRVFARLLSRRALLYTEMVTAEALIHGRLDYLTAHDPSEYPLALQIGGSDPEVIHRAVSRVKDLGFCEINLNVGCPSDRVRAGAFGAALMADPIRVGECLQAMKNAAGIKGPEITAKIRLGINDQIVENSLPEFIETAICSNVERLIIHARKAILGGLSPKQNRDIPPLNYTLVHLMKKTYPDLEIVLNGGLTDLNTAYEQLTQIDGVMIGRAAYQNPQILMGVDPLFYNEPAPMPSAEAALQAYRPYVEAQLAQGFPLKHLSRHLVGLYHEVPGARRYRQILSERAHLPGANWSVIEDALAAVSRPEPHEYLA